MIVARHISQAVVHRVVEERVSLLDSGAEHSSPRMRTRKRPTRAVPFFACR